MAVLALKRDGRGVSEMRRDGKTGVSALALVQQVPAEFLLEAMPTNLHDGQPAPAIVRATLRREMHAILASTDPLVLAYQELAGMSDLVGQRPALHFSGAVGGALPAVNIGWRTRCRS